MRPVDHNLPFMFERLLRKSFGPQHFQLKAAGRHPCLNQPLICVCRADIQPGTSAVLSIASTSLQPS